MTAIQEKDPPCILVTAVSGGSLGEQLCKSFALVKEPLRLIVANTALTPLSIVPVEWQRVVLPPAASPDYIDNVIASGHEHGVKFIAPGSEIELAVLSLNQARLESGGFILLANHADVIQTCLDKTRCMGALHRLGFRVPRTYAPAKADDLRVPGGQYPVILKPDKAAGGSAMCFLAQDEEELALFQRYIFKAGVQPLVQEYVGRVSDEFTVGVLHRPDRSFAGVVVMRRDILSGFSNRLRVTNRTGRAELGDVLAVSSGITQGAFVRHDEVADVAVRIADALQSRGPLNIQGRWDGSGFVPFEINPRFSGTAPMRTIAGFNEAWELTRWHISGKADSLPPIRGGAFRRSLVEHFAPDGSVISVNC